MFSTGSKFPSKTLEVSLEVNVQFAEDKGPGPPSLTDKFCVEENVYIQVSIVYLFYYSFHILLLSEVFSDQKTCMIFKLILRR